MSDIIIGIVGGSAIFLAMDHRQHVRKWGPVLGLITQPFWFWMTWSNELWGVFALCPLYTWGWWRGFKREWFK
jgi:hypothetical protein